MGSFTKSSDAAKKHRKNVEDEAAEKDDTSAIGSVEVSPPDLEDVLDEVYNKIRAYRRNKDLEDEHKLAATKRAYQRGAE